MAAIFRFLGVDDTFTPDTSQRHLELSVPRLAGVSHTLRKLGVWQFIKRITPAKLLMAAQSLASLTLEERPASMTWLAQSLSMRSAANVSQQIRRKPKAGKGMPKALKTWINLSRFVA